MLKKQQLQKKYQHISQKYQNKIAFRYLSIAIIFLMVIQLLISGIENKFVYQHEIERVVQVVETDADFFSIIARDAFLRYDRVTLEKLANSVNEKRDLIYSLFIDRNQQIIAYEIKQKYLAEQKLSAKNNSATTPQDLINRIKNDRKVTEISRVVKNGDRIIGEIRLAYSVENIQQEIKILSLLDLAYATLISILFATLTLVIFNQQILHPLKKIKQLAKEFAIGNLEPRVNFKRKDEIGELGDALNSMASQFQYTLSNLEKVMDEALIAEKAKSKFLGKMSHELRTPLNGIIGFTQLMQQEPTNTTEELESLKIIESNALHLLDLINDVLEITKIESGKSSLNISKFNFYHFLESLEQMFTFKAQQKNIELIFEIEETVPNYIENDPDKMRQIIANLLDNSIKFTNQGRVTMTVKKKKDESHQNCQNLYFKIADTGKGIALEEIDNLFIAFAQTESRGKAAEGMGLGLPMSKQLLQLMGGDISIKSEIDRGTVIRFSIPLTEVDVTDLNFPPPPNWEIESLDTDSMESQFFYDRTSSYDLTKNKLAIMPSEWLLELQESTIKVDNDLIFSILERIPNQDQDLKQALIDLIENFNYDSILELTDDALSKKY
jgi:signal transduction histidine kinase